MKKVISVRLSNEANQKCEHAMKHGYSRTDFINQAILGAPYYNREFAQQLLPYFCAIADSLSAIQGNTDLKEEMRKELDAVCQFLRSHQETM